MNHICISTGSFHQHFEGHDYHARLKKCMELDGIEGVELLFDNAEHLMHFELTKEEIDFLKALKFNTIHAPFFETQGKLADYKNTPFYINVMEKIQEIYDQIGAHNINIHPEETSDYSLFQWKDYQYSIENSLLKYGYSLEFYRNLLDENPHFKMVLDVSRAMESNQLNEMIQKFKKDIIYCHVCAFDNGKPNIFLHELDSKTLKKLEPLKQLNCAFISETSHHHPIEFYQKEINFLKKWLGRH